MCTTVLARTPGHEVWLGWGGGGGAVVDGGGGSGGLKKGLKYTVYIKYSTVSVLLTVLVLLPKPNYDVVMMSHPQRQ